MKHLQTYENFFKKVGSKIVDWIDNFGTSDSKIIPDNFNGEELKQLESLGFTKEGVFESRSENIKIIVQKYWDEQVPGYAEPLYQINVNGEMLPSVKDFKDLIKKIKEIIPEIEQSYSKYNL